VQNPGWGTPAQTFAKVNQLYATGRPYNAPVVPGAQEGVRQLHNMGCRLVVVTAREKHEMEESRRWLQEHFAGYPGCALHLLRC
jgi:phosphoglycolate phosphatase-like HAD superfamily hydrolase